MNKIAKILLIIFTLAIFTPKSVFAEDLSLEDLSPEKTGLISTNCASIKFYLKELQKADSKVRVTLGAKYENILNNFMTPLGVRLLKNNIDLGNLSGLQASFSSNKSELSERFKDYSRSFDHLLTKDCISDPAGFYDELQTVRDKRAKLHDVVIDNYSIVETYRVGVNEIRERL
jgi:hypothetical protein